MALKVTNVKAFKLKISLTKVNKLGRPFLPLYLLN